MRNLTLKDHIVLYAKGWYGFSPKGIIYDISRLMSTYCLIDFNGISKREAMDFLITTFVETVSSKHDMINAIRNFFLTPEKDGILYRNPEDLMIGAINISKLDPDFPYTFEELKQGKGLLGIKFRGGN